MTPKVEQFLQYILRPTLAYLQMPDTDRAETLLLGTAVHESAGLDFIRKESAVRTQDMRGGTYGIYHIEEKPYKELLARFTGKYITSPYYARVRGLVPTRFLPHQWPPVEHVIGDWVWATAVARVHFLMIRSKIPAELQNMAIYYKKHYNLALGRSMPEDWLRHYEQYAKPQAPAGLTTPMEGIGVIHNVVFIESPEDENATQV